MRTATLSFGESIRSTVFFLTSKWIRDRRDRETIAHHRAIRAENRAYWAAIHEMVLALAMVFHLRLGGDSLWHDLPEPIMCLIVREAYISILD
jgi:hypothetical protein